MADLAIIGETFVAVRPDTTDFTKDTDSQVSRISGNMSNSLSGAFKGVAAAAGAAFAVDKVKDFAVSVVSSASDMSETVSKATNIFGANADEILEWSKSSATNFGVSRQQALAATSQFGDMFKQLGFTGDAATKASKGLLQTAADLGSFHNVDPTDVLERIGGALRGEYDSLQQLIPNINAARVEQEALAETHKKSAKELTAAEKATAVLAIVQKDGASAANDFAETSGGLANRQRILAAQWEDMKGKLGAGLLPIITKVAGFIVNNMIPAFQKLASFVNAAKEAFSFSAAGEEWSTNGSKIERVAVAVGKGFMLARQAVYAFVEAFKYNDGEITSSGFNGKMEKLGYTVHQVFDQIREWVQTILPQVQEAIEHFVNAAIFLWDHFGKYVLQIVSAVFDLVKQIITTAITVIRETIEFVLAVINGDWSKAWDSLKEIVRSVFDLIWQIVESALRVLGTLLQTGISAAKELAVAAFNLLVEGVKASASGLWDFITGLPQAVKDLMAEAGTWLFEKGKEIIQGLINGIKGAGEAVGNALVDVGKSAVKKFGSSLKFGSPSKVFIEFGENMMKGLAIGISDNAHLPANALGNLGLGIAGGGFSGGGAFSGRGVLEVNVNAPGATPETISALRGIAQKEIAGALNSVIRGTTAGVGGNR